MTGIYKITSPTGRIYIGQTVNLKHRIRGHKNKPCNPILKSSYLKYGFANHIVEIIHELPKEIDKDLMTMYEQRYIDIYRNAGFKLMNSKGAGSVGTPSKESLLQMVATRKANDSYSTPAHVIEMRRNRLKGKAPILSAECRDRIRQKLIGKVQSEESKAKNRASQLGRKHSEETKRKIGLSKIGRERRDSRNPNKEKRIYKWSQDKRDKRNETRKINKQLGVKYSYTTLVRVSRKGIPQTESHKIARSIAIKKWWDSRKAIIL